MKIKREYDEFNHFSPTFKSHRGCFEYFNFKKCQETNIFLLKT